jgi:Dolichyl-phosphate-mannose-protein mannosyltransferase
VRLRLAQVLFAAALVAAILCAWAWLTGGFRVKFLGIPLSVRGADRAAFVALACAIAGTFLHDGLQRRLWKTLEAANRLPVLPTIVALSAVLVFVAGIRFGTRAAGGADVYGYVSQAELWRTGDLRVRQDFVASVPWPNAEWSFCPLGYRPAGNYTIVPTYPPGLPLLMLLFSFVLGSSGPYYVPWVAGGALVLLTYALGKRLSGPVVGTIAAVSVACSPIVLMMTFATMSDVPVAALWAASLLLATRRTVPGAAASAVMAGIAVLVRPNIVPLAVVPLFVSMWGSDTPGRRSWLMRAAAFAAAFAPFPIFIAWLFNELYGSPFTSGYGDNSAMFAWSHIPINLRLYPQWIWQSQGPFVFVFLLAPLFMFRRAGDGVLRAAFLTFIALLFCCYLLYLPFDEWWYTRFLIPAYPLMFILAAEVVWLAAERFGKRTRAAAALLFALLMIYYGASNTYQRQIHRVGHGEQKYAEVGRHVDLTLPKNAIIYAMQHSGTVRHYSEHLTVRYDYIEPDWLDRSIDYLVQQGYEPFFLLDNWEVTQFQERFASQKHVTLVAREPEERPCTHTTYLYRIVQRTGLPASERIPQIAGCE